MGELKWTTLPFNSIVGAVGPVRVATHMTCEDVLKSDLGQSAMHWSNFTNRDVVEMPGQGSSTDQHFVGHCDSGSPWKIMTIYGEEDLIEVINPKRSDFLPTYWWREYLWEWLFLWGLVWRCTLSSHQLLTWKDILVKVRVALLKLIFIQKGYQIDV